MVGVATPTIKPMVVLWMTRYMDAALDIKLFFDVFLTTMPASLSPS